VRVSVAQHQRGLEIPDCKTAWLMAHKGRKAMADRDDRYRLAGADRDGRGLLWSPGVELFCGALSSEGKSCSADTLIMELEDSIIGRRITQSYDTKRLPIEG
jgi:hypothetical protein